MQAEDTSTDDAGRGGGQAHGPQRVMGTQTPGRAQHLRPPTGGPLPSWPRDPPAKAGLLCDEAQPLGPVSSASLPVPTQRAPDGHVTLAGPPPHWLSLRGGGVGGTTEILLLRGNIGTRNGL